MSARRVKSVRRAVAVLSGVLALALTSCGNTTTTSSSPSGSHSGPVASPPHTIASGSQTVAPSSGGSPTGSPDHPALVTVGKEPLAWKAVPGSTKDLVTVGDGWTLTVPDGDASARLEGPHPRTILAGDHFTITDAFLDETHALVVSEDRLASQPDRATVVDLSTGRTTVLDQHSQPPTVVGGTWALGPETLVHATSGGHGRYCLATVDLATGHGSTGWCAPPRNGFRSATITASGTTMMTFDDHHPSCRTLNTVTGAQLSPLPDVTDCKGWDSAAIDGTTVWSVVPKDRRIEAAHFYAHTGSGWYDLGPGTSGSLVSCAGSAYFTRDPVSRTDPARLLRWSPETASLTIAYQSKATGNAFLSPPRCGGSHLTVTSYSQSGDEQVTASVG
jgi:hypothetical protein